MPVLCCLQGKREGDLKISAENSSRERVEFDAEEEKVRREKESLWGADTRKSPNPH
jgi:hypothetical protein